jgi:hypothetical protein
METSATSTKTLKSVSLSQFKAQNNITKLSVYTSKAGNLYACDQNGNFVGMLAEDFDRTKDVLVHSMVNTSTSETWFFIANGTPKVEEFSL